jgi:hypothetical protein
MEDKPKKQIARLKEILQDLGMSGRMSMEKAKAIRAKRELAEEIGPYASLGEGGMTQRFHRGGQAVRGPTWTAKRSGRSQIREETKAVATRE